MRTRISISVSALAMAMLAALPTALAQSRPYDRELNAAPIDELKRLYLRCNDAALGGRLQSPDIMHCSVVYEHLKRRAFNGDFDKLLAWSSSRGGEGPARARFGPRVEHE